MIAAWSIKKRIIFTVISLCLASIAILGVFAYERQKHQMQEGLKDQALKDGRLFKAILRGDAEGLARAHAGLDRLDSLLAPKGGRARACRSSCLRNAGRPQGSAA